MNSPDGGAERNQSIQLAYTELTTPVGSGIITPAEAVRSHPRKKYKMPPRQAGPRRPWPESTPTAAARHREIGVGIEEKGQYEQP